MRIGFDVSQTAEDMAGCGFFSYQIISHLLEIDDINQYLLYPVFANYRHPNYKNAYNSNKINVINMFKDYSWYKLNEVWDTLDDNSTNEVLGNPDIIHSNNFNMIHNTKAKKVMTIYDLGYIDCPEYTTEANRLACSKGSFQASIYADHIVTISEFSKEAFLRYYPHYPEERVSVVYLGNRPTITSNLTNNNLSKIKKKLKLEDEFWLAVGTIEPRKNYSLLLEGYAELVNDFGEERPLYIAGGKGWLQDDIHKQLKSLNIEGKVRFLGYVSDEELSVLYSECFAFIYPSFYEGFGLPVLEAMSCGAPVITSKITSLPEVIGDSGLLIDPTSVESLVQCMLKLRNNNQLRENLVQSSFQRAELFSWKKAAKQLLEIYEKTIITESWYSK